MNNQRHDLSKRNHYQLATLKTFNVSFYNTNIYIYTHTYIIAHTKITVMLDFTTGIIFRDMGKSDSMLTQCVSTVFLPYVTGEALEIHTYINI